MKIPTVETCCCCCSLRTGTLIIGILGLIGSIISGIAAGLSLATVLYVINHAEDTPDAKKIRDAAPEIIGVLVSLLIYSVLAFIINCILLMGINQNKARLVRKWVIVSLVLFFIQLGLVILDFLFNPQPTGSSRIGGSLFQLYFIVVVHSFYKQLCQGGAVQ